jgi:hypothetical protein
MFFKMFENPTAKLTGIHLFKPKPAYSYPTDQVIGFSEIITRHLEAPVAKLHANSRTQKDGTCNCAFAYSRGAPNQ